MQQQVKNSLDSCQDHYVQSNKLWILHFQTLKCIESINPNFSTTNTDRPAYLYIYIYIYYTFFQKNHLYIVNNMAMQPLKNKFKYIHTGMQRKNTYVIDNDSIRQSLIMPSSRQSCMYLACQSGTNYLSNVMQYVLLNFG